MRDGGGLKGKGAAPVKVDRVWKEYSVGFRTQSCPVCKSVTTQIQLKDAHAGGVDHVASAAESRGRAVKAARST